MRASWLCLSLLACAARGGPASAPSELAPAAPPPEPAEAARVEPAPPAASTETETAPALSAAPAPAAPLATEPLPRRGVAGGSQSALDRALAEGDRAYAADDLKAAAAAYKNAEELDGRAPGPKVGLVRVALAQTGIASEFGAAPKDPKLLALLARLDAAKQLDAAFGPTELERGRVLLMLGDGARALEALRRAIELVPTDPEAHSALGVALLSTGDAARALAPLRRAVELDPGALERWRALGAAELVLGLVSEAISAFSRAVTL